MPKEVDPLVPLAGALRDLVSWWRAKGIDGLIIGGVAVSILGRPRLTRDVDGIVLVGDRTPEELFGQASQHGFQPRYTEVLTIARESRILLLSHKSSKVDVDVALGGTLPFEVEAVARKRTRRLLRLSLPLPTPEDLIIMKAVAHRPWDLADIVGIRDANRELDLRRIRFWVSQFAEVMEAPEIFTDLEAILSPKKKRKRGS